MQNMPLVSVIIPTHNRPELLLEALASIAGQTMTDWQVIIVDDGSSPIVNEQEIKAQFGNKFRVISHADPQGGPTAKNTGVNAATGKYLAFLDDDDLFAPTYLATAIEALEANPQISTLFMDVEYFGTNVHWVQANVPKTMEKVLGDAQGINKYEHVIQFDTHLFPALLKRVPMPFQRPVTTREHFHQVGLYQQDCLLWDCDWALRATLNNVCGLLNVGLYLQRVDGQGYSSLPRRRLEHALSGLTIKKQLLTNPRADFYKILINDAVIEAGQDVAWEYITQDKGLKAFIFLLGTLRYGVTKLQLKFLLHALYSCIRKNN
ncbi:MAG: glycosyltransferase family 2 protein [Methylococcales bacterium]|jgi:glycosyltransferase involved in cell wall biosynthesis|nr:MAG: glycosyltransferase family 2 protein [Methylococcales bacterium]